MLNQESNSEPPTLTSDPPDKEKDIDVDTWEEGDSLASLLTAQVNTAVIRHFSHSSFRKTKTFLKNDNKIKSNHRVKLKQQEHYNRGIVHSD